MKLNKDTKHAINAGDMLIFSDKEKYIVTNVIPCNRGMCFTIQDINTRQTIYSMPANQLYGSIIEKS